VATIRDVAKHDGVSPATVSRVVNGLVGYSDETRERVENAVKSLSFETDFLARGLKTRQTSVIGLLAPMVSDALASQVMQGVEEEAQERGYAVMLGRTGAKSAYIAGYLRTLRTYRAAGVILISAVITPKTRQLLGPNVPIISVAIKSGSPASRSTTSRRPTTRPATCSASATGASACSRATRRRFTWPSPASAATSAP
jgi:DNA-binding LacI/PurR family transcriptional regulator